MKSFSLMLLVITLAGCMESDNGPSKKALQPENNAGVESPPDNEAAEQREKISAFTGDSSYLYPEESSVAHNKEAVIPPQCYTKHEGKYNPCMTCHQNYTYSSRPNIMSDAGLQSAYDFSEYGFTNRWENLFEDRTDRIAKISDVDIREYIDQDNYTPLIASLKGNKEWTGPIPEIVNYHLGAEAFDEFGFAKDGSDWVAFNYKPLPSTFWPTNGSTDDVIIRLPEAFRKSSCVSEQGSRDVYIVNLALTEIAIQDLEQVSVPAINEASVCSDVNGDGVVSDQVTLVKRRDNYVGDASDVKVEHMLYPQGTEFLHSVRYVGVDDQGGIAIPKRMKELRYMVKTHFRSAAYLNSSYGNENQEKIDENLPNYHYKRTGTSNAFGWKVLGFLEDKQGRLRVQSREESLFCMGCHSTVGSTIDQTFAFPRKVVGAAGWGYINLKGMKDVASVARDEPEVLDYLKVVGGGDEFRQNQEMLQKWFNSDGTVNEEAVRNADVYELITPSVERALSLNKAYLTIVQDQDFHHGRDANLTPAVNVYHKVDENSPVLPGEKTQPYDLRLKWSD
ncbi:MAG: hypothetical protein K6L60_14525 [Oceanobacter sp.]